MQQDFIKIDVAGDVATLTLDRPEVHNAFDEHLISSLSGKLAALRVQEDVHVIVLRGAGKSFSAGADMNWMKRAAGYTVEQNQADAMALATMLNRLYTMPKLTISCVQGAAMGGGMGLVSCCDLVLAGPGAFFSLSEVKLGLIPATIAPYVLRAIGERSFRRYAQTAERIPAADAQRIGLVHQLYDSDQAMEAGLASILDTVRANGPQAMAASKSLAIDLAGRAIDERMINDTAVRIAAARAGDEAKEGLSAFLEKRKAGWVR